jgi:hypothetical protein
MNELGHRGLLKLEVGMEGFALALLTRVVGVRDRFYIWFSSSDDIAVGNTQKYRLS